MKRHLSALVIGNAAYKQAGMLKNPTNDADDVASRLQSNGFSVVKKTDCTAEEMDRALKHFKTALAGNDVGLFFFAGHGMQIDGENYLAAVDTGVSDEIEAKHSSLPLNRIIQTMEKSGTSTNIIILDACRDNPFERAWHRSPATRGLAPVYAPKGTLIAYATSPGQVAQDGSGRNGAYTAALLQHIDTPDCSIETMFKRVRNTLSARTNQKQISWEHTSLSGEFFFNLSVGARIHEYSETALSDKLFVLDESKSSHQVISELKKHDWYAQNPAIRLLTSSQAGHFSKNSLFVIGRNVYQAACGNAFEAQSYITDFVARTQGLETGKRKALLDGMLFEIFFDSTAEIRDTPKTRCLTQVFQLQEYETLSASFEFISECLIPYSDHFYVLPGKGHAVTVDVVMKKGSGEKQVVQSIHYGSRNVLRTQWDDFAEVAKEKITVREFEQRLSEDMVVPSSLLKVTYSNACGADSKLELPFSWTIRKLPAAPP